MPSLLVNEPSVFRQLLGPKLLGQGFTPCLEVFHEYPLQFEGHLLACAKMPGAKESDPDGNIEIRVIDNPESTAQRVSPQKSGL